MTMNPYLKNWKRQKYSVLNPNFQTNAFHLCFFFLFFAPVCFTCVPALSTPATALCDMKITSIYFHSRKSPREKEWGDQIREWQCMWKKGGKQKVSVVKPLNFFLFLTEFLSVGVQGGLWFVPRTMQPTESTNPAIVLNGHALDIHHRPVLLFAKSNLVFYFLSWWQQNKWYWWRRGVILWQILTKRHPFVKDGAIFPFYPKVDARLLEEKRNRAVELISVLCGF